MPTNKGLERTHSQRSAMGIIMWMDTLSLSSESVS